jgi:hypothetical protein
MCQVLKITFNNDNENETLCCHMVKQEILGWWVFGVDNIESDVKGCHRT